MLDQWGSPDPSNVRNADWKRLPWVIELGGTGRVSECSPRDVPGVDIALPPSGRTESWFADCASLPLSEDSCVWRAAWAFGGDAGPSPAVSTALQTAAGFSSAHLS